MVDTKERKKNKKKPSQKETTIPVCITNVTKYWPISTHNGKLNKNSLVSDVLSVIHVLKMQSSLLGFMCKHNADLLAVQVLCKWYYEAIASQ